jgi:hypothetical protein|tara:strand:- start:1414 stop:1923 length:510 start_codon:yes stop_codon:yes gene_type:complete
MAKYIIFTNQPDLENSCVGIAEDETARDAIVRGTPYKVITLSDSDFNNIKKGLSRPISFNSSDVVTYKDVSPATMNANILENDGRDPPWEVGKSYYEEKDLQDYIASLIAPIGPFLENNSGNSQYAAWSDYRNTLENFDTSSLTYPMTQTWEEYCDANGIAYKNLLQLP